MDNTASILFPIATGEVLKSFRERYGLFDLSDMAQNELPGDILSSIKFYFHPQSRAFRAV